jgi:hypothetical protein
MYARRPQYVSIMTFGLFHRRLTVTVVVTVTGITPMPVDEPRMI